MLVVLAISHFLGFSEGQKEETVISDLSYAGLLIVQCLSHAPNASTSWRCGSSIVNQYLMLTAAHCVDATSCDEIAMIVTVGYSNGSMGFNTSVHSYIIHEDYTQKFQANIALVRLISPLEFNTYVSRVALLLNPPDKEMAEIVGWNQVPPTLEIPANNLNYSTHYLLKKPDCVGVTDDLPNGTFCASGNTSDLFKVDIGSALIVHGYIQIGICSSIEHIANDTVFMFTDVAYYYQWIVDSADSIMCENQDKERWQKSVDSERIAVN